MQQRDYDIIITEDGSHSVRIQNSNITFHSVKGAIQESMHVFIQAGLNDYLQHTSVKQLTIFELGFGTGLNALLTANIALEKQISIAYTSVDAYPLPDVILSQLQYNSADEHQLYKKITHAAWNSNIIIHEYFLLRKQNILLLDFNTLDRFDIVYFDAFAPNDQPELWTKKVFDKIYDYIKPNGFLITYCAKTTVRKALAEAGFVVEKLPGPPGKREIVKATKK